MQYGEARVSDIEGVQDGENEEEKGESEDKQDNMIIKILGLKEGKGPDPTVELADCRNTNPEQSIRTRTPLKDVTNLEQERKSVGKVEEGKNGKGHWKRRAQNATVDTKSHGLHEIEACETSEKKRLREQIKEGDVLEDSVTIGKKSKMWWQLAENLHTMVGKTSLNWTQVDK